MVTLADFNQNATPITLQDFTARPQSRPPVFNDATIRNTASYASVLAQPGELDRVFGQISMDLKSNTSSQTLNTVMKKWDEAEGVESYGALQSILYDSTIDADTKYAALQTYSKMATGGNSGSLFSRVAEGALMSEALPTDNDETEFVRLEGYGVMDEVNYYNGAVNKAIQAVRDKDKERGPMASFINLAELFIPFMEGAAAGEVSAQLANARGENGIGSFIHGLTLLGENKAAVRDAIRAAPFENKLELARQIVEFVRNGQGSVTLRPNTLNMIMQLEDYLVTGNYSETDRLVDNIFSVIDDTMLLAPLKVFGKAAKAIGDIPEALKGLNTLKVDKADIARFEVAKKNLEAPELLADIEKNVSETLPVMSDALSNESKIDIRGSLEEVLREKIVPLTPPDMIESTINTIKQKMDELTPAVDVKTWSADLIQRTTDNISRSVFGKQKVASVPNTPDELFVSNVTRRAVQTDVDPTSISQVFKDTNHGKYQAMHQMVVDDTTGRAAEIMYGTSRSEVIAHDHLPEVGTVGDSVRNKVAIDESAPRPNNQLIEEFNALKGRTDMTPEEKMAARADVIRSFDEWRDVHGLYTRENMSSIKDSSRGVEFRMVYGPKHNGFINPHTAIENAEFGLKKYGVTRDNIEILGKNQNGEYEPVDLAKAPKSGNYLIGVKFDYEFSPADTISLTMFDKSGRMRLFDFPFLDFGRQGSLSQNFIPMTSVVENKKLLTPAHAASTHEAWLLKKLVEMTKPYAKKYGALDRKQKYLVDSYRVEANAKGIPFNAVNLEARGMSPEAIDTLRDWKHIQDTIYYFENADYKKTLRAQGYQRFIDKTNDTDLIVRPMVRSRVGEATEVYDPVQNEFRKFSKEELDELYEKGGSIAETKSPIDVEGNSVTRILVTNTSDSNYVRAFNDNDQILNYRHGYYHIEYENPVFIERINRSTGAVEVIARADGRASANKEVARLIEVNGSKYDYKARPDIKRGNPAFKDAEWGQVVSSGRSAQRVRGAPLAKIGETRSDINDVFMQSPEESLVNAIYQTANKAAFRDFIETSKARWMNQFSEMVTDSTGRAQWPTDAKQIGALTTKFNHSQLSDARAVWRYIDSLDSGFVNLIDDWSKNFFRYMTDTISGKGWGWAERTTRAAAKFGPSTFARKKAFRLMLAANPARQLLVQSMQALPTIAATNPAFITRVMPQMTLLNYIARGGDVDSFMKMIAQGATGLSPDEAKMMVQHWQSSGFEAAVEANSLIRDDITRLIDKTPLQKGNTALAQPLNFAQKWGFNLGENILMRSVWLSEYDKLRRLKGGKEISPEDLEVLTSKVRALTFDMDKAGELPYNTNTFSALAQFLQAPHKAMFQVFGAHKGLSGAERAKLGTAYILSFGIGMTPATSILSNILPGEDSVWKNMIEGGFFNLLLNSALTNIYGEEVNVDFSDSFRLLQFPNVAEFITNVATMNLTDMITSSPSGSLVFGQNPRVTEFILAAARPFYVSPEQKPDAIRHAAIEFGNMFSGMSNFTKSMYMLEIEKSMSSSGVTTDYHVSTMEALMRIFGFQTMDEVRHYAMTGSEIEINEKINNDVNYWLREMDKRLALDNISQNSVKSILDISSEAMKVWKDNPRAMEIINQQLRYRARTGESTLLNKLFKYAGWVDEDKFNELVENAPSHITVEQRQQLKEFYKMNKELAGKQW